jgi:uncharacterized protein YpmB
VISFRYHIVSIIAVFLALALGIVVGTTALNGPITTNLRDQVHAKDKSISSLTQKTNLLQTQVDQAQQFAATYGSQIVKGALTNQKVLIVGLPGADTALKDGVSTEVVAAGGQVTGRVQLTSDYVSPQRASDLNSLAVSLHPLGLTLPATDDVGVVVGALLSWVLLGHGKETDIKQVMTGFQQASYLKVEKDPTPATMVVVVAHGTLPVGDASGKTELTLVDQLQQAGGHVVVAGDTLTSTGGGVLALVRADDTAKGTVSTVDNADTSVGQVSTVLALADLAQSQVGHYGTGSGAKAMFPDVAK